MFKLEGTNNLPHLKPLKTLQTIKSLIPIFHLHNKSTPNPSRLSNPLIDFILNEAPDKFKESSCSSNLEEPQYSSSENEGKENESSSRVRMSHPWPEWLELMEKLVKSGYFGKTGHPFGRCEMGSKDFNHIRTACLNFARDRFDILRFLSRKNIQVVAGSGCPSLDRKVVSSGKRLRAHVGINEGNVCSSCILRGNCERAYVKACEEEGGRTIDVMRILLTYGLDFVIGCVENKPCLNKKVNESVRTLLKEVVAFGFEGHNTEQGAAATTGVSAPKLGSAWHPEGDKLNTPLIKQGDWNCPKCNFLNFARNVKCLQCEGLFHDRLRILNEEQAHLPLKKGDWICDKCNFLNFAKNTKCLQCKEKPANREISSGEWECDSCNYLNFKRNMVCLKCDHKRPKALNTASPLLQHSGDNTERHHPHPYFGQEKHFGDKGADDWAFVNEDDQDRSNPVNNVSGFFDFPVKGGKSDLSQDVHMQELWRMEMAQQRRDATTARENADRSKSFLQRNRELLTCSDDKEMTEWFGPRQKVSNIG